MCKKLKVWRQAASLILAAKSPFNTANFQILCLKRSSKSGFMPNSYVFPGGNLSDADRSVEWRKIFEKYPQVGHLAARENTPPILRDTDAELLPNYLAFRICAIRETFEECGVLLCRKRECNEQHKTKWASYIESSGLIEWRKRVYNSPAAFEELCKHFDCCPDVWALHLWTNWATPPSFPLKFNTIFFLATFNQLPSASPDGKEVQNLMWKTSRDYLDASRDGGLILPPPQYYELSRLENFHDIDELARFASERSQNGCETYLPHRILTDSGLYSILPGDDLYPKCLDKDNPEVTRMDKLPACEVKHRIYSKSSNSNELIIENFTPNCGHVAPLCSKI